MRLYIFLTPILLATIGAAQPATAPATAPASEPQALHGGRVLFVAPPELTFLGKRDDDRSASFRLGESDALVTLLVTPQEHAIRDEIAPRLAQLIGKTIRDEAAAGQLDIIMQPKVEQDDRFLLRVHDKFNTEERFGDRIQIYRSIGFYLVSVTATAFTEDPEQARIAHELGEHLLVSVRLNRESPRKPAPQSGRTRTPTTRPVTFEAAGLRVVPPAGWTAEPTENPSGTIVTYRDPQDETNLISISTRKLPPEARRDAELRDIVIEQMVNSEKLAFRVEGSLASGDTQIIRDRRFLRKTRTDYAHHDKRFSVTSRQIRSGDLIVSVTSLALDSSVQTVDQIADDVAIKVRALPSATSR